MDREKNDPQGREHANLSSTSVFDVFSDITRRTVLFHLRQHRAATLDELVDVLVEVSEYDTRNVDREDIRASLIHTHLPKLEQEGFITYDSNERVARSANLSTEIGEWLDLAVRRDIQFDLESEPQERTSDDEQATYRVLFVDDEPGLPDTIANYLEREYDDMEVTTATSALEAVTILNEESFDCIVSDYKMPAISGLDFLNAVRDEDPSIPFIVFTAKGSEETASRAIATGVTDYVQKKPDTDQYDELAERIRQVVD